MHVPWHTPDLHVPDRLLHVRAQRSGLHSPQVTRIMKELRNHLSGLTVDDLRETCRGHPDLTVGGNKPELIDRIVAREVFILKKGVVPDNYTVDDIKCLLRGHKWTIGEGKKEDFMYWAMILIASHLFLRGEEVRNILLCNIYIREIVYEDGYPGLVKRFILGVMRKGGSTTNFQISREDDFPKLCII